ncbi:hypothetical protein [Endozoicomonas numazuensis]|uniref:Uncharacterized protein n=1 Tax=Endozoicomonas numazuensis TaxID=1137799 RepID=A0A081N166_9GAMM|nr:hypothetical protein [Endozoicomonas numazuensis]KEQ12189.1 hypothetical protein GZ78_27475 [Endozoicomonas numazuensis]
MQNDIDFLKKKLKHTLEELEYCQNIIKRYDLEKNEKKIKFLENNINTFDEEFYLEKYPDVKKSSLSPYEHYEKYGKILGRIAHRKN